MKMEKSEVLVALNRIFQEVVDDPNVVLKQETTAQDVDDWDSLNHITFIVAIEKYFRIKFSGAEIRSWKNVGEMCNAIAPLV
jgi:acyl carrier protein